MKAILLTLTLIATSSCVTLREPASARFDSTLERNIEMADYRRERDARLMSAPSNVNMLFFPVYIKVID